MITSMMKRNSSKFAKKNKQELMMYATFTVAACIGAAGFSNLKLSACLSLSSGLQALGFSLLMLKAYNDRDVSTVSLSTLALFVVALGFRLFATLQYDGYQPQDATGKNGLYHTIETIEMFLALAACFLVRKAMKRQCHISEETPALTLILLAICGVLAMTTHGVLNASKLGDVTWMMGFYVETIAMMPQLYQLQKTGGEVEALHGHYIASTFASAVVRGWFWVEAYKELQPRYAEYNVPGMMVMGAQALQMVASADFMYLYIQSVRNNQKLIVI